TDSVYDYDDPTSIDQLREATTGGVDGAIDHTGSRSVRRAVRAGGRVVRTAFGGAPGQGRSSTATGVAASTLRRYARPGERTCSVPILVTTGRARYRQALTELFTAAGNGTLVPPSPHTIPPPQYPDPLPSAIGASPGEKTILTTQATSSPPGSRVPRVG